MSQVPVGEDGYPTIFGSILRGDGEFEDVNVDSMECDEGLPRIQPINPNVRARKLEVNGGAKTKLEEDVANGVTPPIKKRMKSKQAAKKKTLKANMTQQWYPSDPHAAEASKGQHTKGGKRGKPTAPKAKEDVPACRKGMKYADALILSAHGSCNAATGRFDIQGKCTLPDGSCKKVGVLGFCCQESFGMQVWETLMAKINDAKGKITKGEIVMLRDKLIAGCKAGHQRIDLDVV